MPTGTTRCEFTRQGNLGWKGRERLVSSLQRMLVLKTPFLKGRGLPGEEEPFGGKAGTLRPHGASSLAVTGHFPVGC